MDEMRYVNGVASSLRFRNPAGPPGRAGFLLNGYQPQRAEQREQQNRAGERQQEGAHYAATLRDSSAARCGYVRASAQAISAARG